MNSSSSTVTLMADPAWPWSLSSVGLPALAAVALLLIGLTVWTYRGAQGISSRRMLTVLGLRLAALLLAVLAVVRPSLAFRDDLRLPSKVLVAADYSESMRVQDEFGNQSRWSALLQTLRDCEPVIQRLRSEHHIDVVLYQFGADVRDFDPQGQAGSKRTDHGLMLERLYRDHSHERFLRCLIVAGDGADNGTRVQPLGVAGQWRSLPCPVHTIGFGKQTTSDQQNDIAVTSILVDPSPVPVKGAMTIKAVVDAPGLANAAVNLRLLIDDKEVTAEKVFINDRDVTGAKQKQLSLTTGNEVRIQCTAPPQPGEVKVTLQIDPLSGELITANNDISTFHTVAKEGLSVLLVDKTRYPEPQFICDALSKEPSIRVHPVWFRRDPTLDAGQLDLFQFDKQHYDVIILGDVSAGRLAQAAPQALAKIRELVDQKGAGLLMMGGYDSFGNSDWQGTDIAKLLPVQIDGPGQLERRVKLEPTEAGIRHYILRLEDQTEANDAAWKRLPPLDGITRLGTVKPGAVVFARSGAGETMLAGHTYGSGRVLAFAGDTTHRWKSYRTKDDYPQGLVAHHRFWKQLVLWLAKQEETEGNAWVKLDTRRLASGGQVGFTVGLRGKGGVDTPDTRFEVKVVGPDGGEAPVPTARDMDKERGTFWKTDVPGEYRMIVKARGKEADGQEASGEATARFLVYQDTVEMTIRRADHDFLKKLAASGGGQFHRPGELKEFLQELAAQPLPQLRPKAALWPEWRRNSLSGFVVGFFLLFVSLLGLEWFLRRRWGMV